MGFINLKGVDAIPTAWLPNTHGNIVDLAVGSKDLEGWRTEIERILAEFGA